jgi:hypothetical protein
MNKFLSKIIYVLLDHIFIVDNFDVSQNNEEDLAFAYNRIREIKIGSIVVSIAIGIYCFYNCPLLYMTGILLVMGMAAVLCFITKAEIREYAISRYPYYIRDSYIKIPGTRPFIGDIFYSVVLLICAFTLFHYLTFTALCIASGMVVVCFAACLIIGKYLNEEKS